MLKRLANRIQSLQKHARLPVAKLSGTERFSGATLNLLYAGTSSQKAYIKSHFFEGEAVETDLGTGFSLSLNRLAANNDCDLVVAIQARSAQDLLPRSGYTLPLWVSSEADTTVSPFQVSNKSLKADLARVRKNQLSCEHSRAPSDLEYFWEHMYVPHIKCQHADQAILESIDEFSDLIAKGKLLVTFTSHEGRRVAGGTLTTDGPIPRSRHIGLLNGDYALKRLGVMTAVYIYELDWAFHNGHERLMLGATRPFFSDGILQYKKKFNISLRNSDYKKVIYINPVTQTDAAVSALVSNPMICVDKGDLVATVLTSQKIDGSQFGSPWLHHGELMSGLREVKSVQLSER